MPAIGSVDAFFVGADTVAKVYLGADLVWPVGLPKISTLVDNFTTLDDGTWAHNGVDISSGRARVVTLFDNWQHFQHLTSHDLWDLTDSYILFEVTGLAPEDIFGLALRQDRLFNQYIYVAITNGELSLQGWDDESTVSYDDIAYNATAHRWLRVRHTAATVHLDVSPDGVTWSNSLFSVTEATLGWTPDSVDVLFFGGSNDEESPGGYVYLDNVGVPPA